MGVDFLKSKAKSFNKGWDRGRRELAAACLFVGAPELAQRRFLAESAGTAGFQAGEQLLGAVEGESVRLSRNGHIAGYLASLPLQVLNRLRNDAYGVTLVTVHVANPISGTAEVSLA